MNAEERKDNEDMKTGDMLEHISLLEELSFELNKKIEEKTQKEAALSKFKGLISFLFENQTFKDKYFNYLLPANEIIILERKLAVNMTQEKISVIQKEISSIEKAIQNYKKQIVKNISSVNESNYLEDNIKDLILPDIIKKFSKEKKEIDEEED